MTALREVISLASHPSETDENEKLISGNPYAGRGIFKTTSGYVALLGDGRCFAGYFSTWLEARQAQSEFFGR